SDPAGAQVLVDGKPSGEQTPAALRGLHPGEHTVQLRHPSFNEIERTVRLDDGARQVVDVHLLPRSRTVELSTVPAGATVLRDGELVGGKTPMSVALSEGEYHALRIEKTGYETVTQKLQPEDHGTLPPVVLEQEKESRGTVFVDAAAPAAVWIDG